MNKCQCPYEDDGRYGSPHNPSECEGKNVKMYLRDGEKIALCINCVLTGDEEL